jgi:hypothetical protein
VSSGLIVDMVMDVKFINNIHVQVFNRMGPDYQGLTARIIIDQCVGIPGEGYDS